MVSFSLPCRNTHIAVAPFAIAECLLQQHMACFLYCMSTSSCQQSVYILVLLSVDTSMQHDTCTCLACCVVCMLCGSYECCMRCTILTTSLCASWGWPHECCSVGAFLVVPCGQYKQTLDSPTLFTAYVYARGHWHQPFLRLPATNKVDLVRLPERHV